MLKEKKISKKRKNWKKKRLKQGQGRAWVGQDGRGVGDVQGRKGLRNAFTLEQSKEKSSLRVVESCFLF